VGYHTNAKAKPQIMVLRDCNLARLPRRSKATGKFTSFSMAPKKVSRKRHAYYYVSESLEIPPIMGIITSAIILYL